MADRRIKDITTTATTAAADDYIPIDGTTNATRKMLVEPLLDIGLPFLIHGGGSAITTGIKGNLEVPCHCNIYGWTVLADQTGSIVVDIWKDTYANYPPTVADTITGTEKPTLSSASKNQDVGLTTWTTTLFKGDILRYNVDSAATVTNVTINILARRRA